ncbi:hypothetical protein [Endozoicomonas ascidiicola]|uniref:hypothetical protein n=1 Tax=Endozoicomonas ascidiicola TaxID=1698521 RepID=UPI0008354049|nr:hypothetical protein [Endozoicomonas ascidiicola]
MRPEDKISLPQALKDHFSNHELSEDQLQILLTRQSSIKTVPMTIGLREKFSALLRLFKRPSVLLAPVLVLMVTVIIIAPVMILNDLTEQVVNEVAYNHNKQMAMEVQSSQLDQVAGYLSQLGFPLIGSKYLPSNQWELLGGRYCSIQGKLAAQLKLRNRQNNRIYTFYQSLLPEPMASLKRYESYVDGIRVSLWQENNLLLGLAGQPEP